MTLLPRLMLLAALVSLSLAHICLLYPDQRGGANITGPGSHNCYQPQAPCGTKPAGTPTVTLVGGSYFSVLFQQNLNHYNPGWPGFLDVAWAIGTNQTSDDGFTILSQIPDYWPHLQAQQTNFSVPILVPNIDCDHCTLRVRYHPNKPTEPIFHNCADIKIVKSASPLQSPTWGKVIATVQQGPPFGLSNAQNQIVSITPTGAFAPVMLGQIGVRAVSSVPLFQAQGLIASNANSPAVYFIGGSSSDFTLNTAPSALYTLNTQTGAIFSTAISHANSASLQQWSAIVATGNSAQPFILVGSQAVVLGSTYSYSVYYLYSNGTTSNALITTAPDDTYLNTFWLDYDAKNNIAYFLTGDENSLYDLVVVLYSFNLNTGNYTKVNVDNSKYTLSAVHFNPADSQLYAVSPGLFGANGPWTLVRINPSTGNVTAGPVIAPVNQFLNNYWGAVYGPGVTVNGEILHVFQTPTKGLVLAGIDVNSGKFTFTTGINNGINSAVSLTGFTYLPPTNGQ